MRKVRVGDIDLIIGREDMIHSAPFGEEHLDISRDQTLEARNKYFRKYCTSDYATSLNLKYSSIKSYASRTRKYFPLTREEFRDLCFTEVQVDSDTSSGVVTVVDLLQEKDYRLSFHLLEDGMRICYDKEPILEVDYSTILD